MIDERRPCSTVLSISRPASSPYRHVHPRRFSGGGTCAPVRHRSLRWGTLWRLHPCRGRVIGFANTAQRCRDRAFRRRCCCAPLLSRVGKNVFHGSCSFKCRGKTAGNKGVYIYRAGRPLEEGDFLPACMGDAFKCLGKVAHAALCAIARHLRLRSDVFNHLLDDNPLPANEVSSSVLVAAFSHGFSHNGRVAIKPSTSEVEKGLLTVVASDGSGIQVCDPNGRWYLADAGLGPNEVLLLTGRTLNHATAGLRPAALFRTSSENFSGAITGGRASLMFRLMPRSSAVLDCSPIAVAGHIIPQSYQPISVSQFMDDLSMEEDILCNHLDSSYVTQDNLVREPSLRSVLSDPISGAFLEDAVAVSCGHSFGGDMLKKVMEMARCSLCNVEIETGFLIPNLALRAAATSIKYEDERRLFHNSALRKRRKEGSDLDPRKRLSKENGEISVDGDTSRQERGVQYPFAVSEKVLIKGNRRTPDKFVGREAVITSQCLNGWYLLEVLDSRESIRLQYRSLRKLSGSQPEKQPSNNH